MPRLTVPRDRESECLSHQVRPGALLIVKALASLVRFDLCLTRRNFARLYGEVSLCPVARRAVAPGTVERICSAIDIACIWYWKRVLCLERSAATTCLLRRYGIAASMVIGAEQIPFKAHAWVEVEGQVVNDKPYMREMYAVLDRC
jgi:Transglutaminase-like superfamily